MAQPNKFFAAAALVCALVPASASAQTASSTTEILAPLPLPPVVPAMPDMVIPSFAEVAQTLPPSIPPPTASIAPFDPDARDLKLFVVINNSRQELTCAFRSLDGPWQPWINVRPAENWQGDSKSRKVYFQCRPPVRQILYSLKNGTRYSLQPDGVGEIRIVEVTASRPRPSEKPSWDR
ncbi:MAG TPA: hypothetical protein VKC17_12645 [Sphingomicrobium sp.]|nr:hypothetical protein [Sphingomicrobium sp.]